MVCDSGTIFCCRKDFRVKDLGGADYDGTQETPLHDFE